MKLTSTAFQHKDEIPVLYTCEGDDISPPLNWTNVPSDAKSLVFIVDDPDAPDPNAPQMTWVHWVLYNIPPDTNELPQAVASDGLPSGTLEGVNDWRRTGYGGPCPPIGRHRYFLKLYALDKMLPDLGGPEKTQVEEQMQGHIIGETTLVGTYQKCR